MRVPELIRKKRDGEVLSPEQIHELVTGFVRGDVPDYQMSAFLMAVYFRGLTDDELLALTRAMIDSGARLNLTQVGGVAVDKHSTGGVGDKTTLVLVPLVAAAGGRVMKMSGRGLGFTGGTIDKLESFPGLRTELTLDEMIQLVRRHGACVGSQTGNLTPADKRIYALRDVTGTVESIPLVAASVMSKKIAAGAQGFVLDVKCGRGAFAKDLASATSLATSMLSLAKLAGRQAVALVTDMEQPLGYTVGNALEVKEALATLRGEGPPDLVELTLVLGSEMLVLGKVVEHVDEGHERLMHLLQSGEGLAKLREIVEAQGGDPRPCDDPSLLPQAPYVSTITASADGYVHSIDALAIGTLSMELGAGRSVQGGDLDLAVGIELYAKVGDKVRAGQVLGYVHGAEEGEARMTAKAVQQAVAIDASPALKRPLIHTRLTAS